MEDWQPMSNRMLHGLARGASSRRSFGIPGPMPPGTGRDEVSFSNIAVDGGELVWLDIVK